MRTHPRIPGLRPADRPTRRNPWFTVVLRPALFALLLVFVEPVGNAAAAQPAPELHHFRFFLHTDLAATLEPAERERRLALYVEDLNAIFAKQTIRRFTFDPKTDIVVTNTAPHTRYTEPPLPTSGFEIWAWVQRSDQPVFGSYGGQASYSAGGIGVAEDLHWDAIHDRNQLLDAPAETPELVQYWRQLHHLIHELEHIFGAGTGEYYRLRSVLDTTGEPPHIPIQSSDLTTDPYWSRHPDFWNDPLLIWLPTLGYRDLTNGVRFANVTAAILNGPYRERWNDLLPDPSRTEIRVLDEGSLAPIPQARVRAWKVAAIPEGPAMLFDEGFTDAAGRFAMPWDPKFMNYDMTLLVKVYPADGRPPVARWYSIFDAQEQLLVDGLDHPVISLTVPPAPATETAPSLLLPLTDLTANEGDAAVLHVAASGSAPLSYQWTLDGTGLAQTTVPFVTLTNPAPPGPHTWSVTVSNPAGTITAGPASLRITASDQVLDWRRLRGLGGQSDESPGGLAVDRQGNLFCAINSQGSVLLEGESVPVGRNGLGWVLVRYDASGNRTWHRSPIGPDAGSEARAIAVNDDGDCYVYGWLSGTFNFGGGLAPVTALSRNVFVAKYGPDGSIAWVRMFGGPGYDDAQGMSVNSSGLCAITGSFTGTMPVGTHTLAGTDGTQAFFLAVLDPRGEPSWAIASTDASYAEGMRVALDANGGGFVTVNLAPPATVAGLPITNLPFTTIPLIRFDPSGKGLWATNVAARNATPAIIGDRAGGVLITGQSPTGTFYVSHLSGSGGTLWSTEGRGFFNDSGRAIATDAAGNVFVAGELFSSPMALGGARLPNRGASDAAVLALDSTGRVLWGQSMGGASYDTATGVAVDPRGRVHVAGTFLQDATFGPGVLRATGNQDGFIATLGPIELPEPALQLGARPAGSGAELELTFPTRVGGTYIVESGGIGEGIDSGWKPEREFAGSGGTVTLNVPMPRAGHRFFRVRTTASLPAR